MKSTWIGPIQVNLYNVSFSLKSVASGDMREGSMSVTLERPQSQQVLEMINNPDGRWTVGDNEGILEYFRPEGELLELYRGWYLFMEASESVRPDTLTDRSNAPRGLVDLDITLLFLGDFTRREAVVSFSGAELSNDFAITGKSVLVAPFLDDSARGFLLSPGGSVITREYDPTTFDPSLPFPPSGSAQAVIAIDFSGDIASPIHDEDWYKYRGLDVRAWDRRLDLSVYGPTHEFKKTTDIGMGNGLISFWVGNEGLAPFLNVAAYADGWQQIGTLEVGKGPLIGARLICVTPDFATVVLLVKDAGPVYVTLLRGARMILVTHGDPNGIAMVRGIAWKGTPPVYELRGVVNGEGKFNKGLYASRDEATWADPQVAWADPYVSWTGVYNPTIRFLWPQSHGQAEWTYVIWTRPRLGAAALPDSGITMLMDDAQEVAAELRYVHSDNTYKLRIGDTEVSSSVQTFAEGDFVALVARLSPTKGMSLSTYTASAGLVHVKSADQVDPGTFGAYESIYIAGSDGTTWGDGDWGDGHWGGIIPTNANVDNLMLFEDYLSDAEVAELVAAQFGLDGLPSPSGRLIWHAPLDAHPLPRASAVTQGRMYEATTVGGDTRYPDDSGLTKAIVSVDSEVVAGTALEMIATSSTQLTLAAVVATTNLHDDVYDYQRQIAFNSIQQTLVR